MKTSIKEFRNTSVESIKNECTRIIILHYEIVNFVLYYTARCETPQCIVQVADSITVMGYRDSNLLSVTSFPNDCCSGILVTTGQNRTECMDEGQWQLLPNSTEMETETEG